MRTPSFLAAVLLVPAFCLAQSPKPEAMFLEFVRRQAAEFRSHDKPPASLAEWQARCAALRTRLEEAWGGFPATPCPLQPRVVGTLRRDGYRVEKILLQTRPDVWMTANAYVPDRPGKLPAVLCVHGHWPGAKQDPVVQARCLGLVKLGFFVLAVDAFGAGERGLTTSLGEYHGEMVAATLLPVGLPLCGLQVYENRARDRLPADPARGRWPAPGRHRGQRRREPVDVRRRRGTIGSWLRRRSARSAIIRPIWVRLAVCVKWCPGPCGLPRKPACWRSRLPGA